jgi:small multidrug resistance family-3 protein
MLRDAPAAKAYQFRGKSGGPAFSANSFRVIGCGLSTKMEGLPIQNPLQIKEQKLMREMAILIVAAALEVGGDALVRWGLRGGQIFGLLAGGLVLFVYGLTVNVPKWDFGRLLGVYIAVFFVVSQLVALLFFHEKLKAPMIAGGILIIAGGVVMTVWHPEAEVTAQPQVANVDVLK